VKIRLIQPEELRVSAALHTGEPGLDALEHTARQQVWLRVADEEGIDLSQQVVFPEADALGGACLFRVNPGRAAAIFRPAFPSGSWRPELAVRLIRAARREALARGVHLCQSLLPLEVRDAHRAFLDAGFQRLATLLHLERTTPPEPAPAGRLSYERHRPANRKRLADVILRSYVGSLDCPALNDRRRIEDVIASHKATGIYDPAYWMLARDGGTDVGCLLMNRCRIRTAWEIVYLAVLPEQRGKGYGQELVARALQVAAGSGVPTTLVAVDKANGPAVRLYRHAGFRTHLKTVAFVSFSDDPPTATRD
jgi:GNAT superfamily N-acetyltransferase